MNEVQITLNDDGSYMSPVEIVRKMMDELVEDDRELLKKKVPRAGDMVMFHHTTGMRLRNRFGLWRADNPHVKLEAEPNAQGIVDHPKFPDNLSGDILEAIWICVNTGHSPEVACQMKGIGE